MRPVGRQGRLRPLLAADGERRALCGDRPRELRRRRDRQPPHRLVGPEGDDAAGDPVGDRHGPGHRAQPARQPPPPQHQAGPRVGGAVHARVGLHGRLRRGCDGDDGAGDRELRVVEGADDRRRRPPLRHPPRELRAAPKPAAQPHGGRSVQRPLVPTCACSHTSFPRMLSHVLPHTRFPGQLRQAARQLVPIVRPRAPPLPLSARARLRDVAGGDPGALAHRGHSLLSPPLCT